MNMVKRSFRLAKRAAEKVKKINTAVIYSKRFGDLRKIEVKSIKYAPCATYDYVVIVPWLIPGGADNFAINYANSVQKLNPTKKVLIIATESSRSSHDVRALGLSKKIDFLPLAELVKHDANSDFIIFLALKEFLHKINPKVVHVILSKLGYQYIKKEGNNLKQGGTKIILTGFNNSITNDAGELIGYAVHEIPDCYQYADIITTDNQKTKQRWVTLFNFSSDKIVVHNSPISMPSNNNSRTRKKHTGLHILWAAHIRREKNPETLISIAKSMLGENVKFSCYGELDINNYSKNPFVMASLNNLRYMGSYSNFFTDIDLPDYDLFLYTTLSDGTPTILIEAGLAKLPIITSGVGGIPELLSNRGTIISNPTSVSQFVKAIKSFQANRANYNKKAADFYKFVVAQHSRSHFEKQVRSMLEVIGFE